MDFEKRIRLLAVDDDSGMLDVYRRVLLPRSDDKDKDDARLAELERRLFNRKSEKSDSVHIFDLTLCRQGDEALKAVKYSIREDNPYAVAFIDVRLPPGPDGVWTAENIRSVDPNIDIVIVTAYSDVLPAEIAGRCPPSEKLFYIQKPFHSHELLQAAVALGGKWRAERRLEDIMASLENTVKDRTAELADANRRLQEDLKERLKAERVLRENERKLTAQANELSSLNTALKVLLDRREREKKDDETKILDMLDKMVRPYLDRLESSAINEEQRELIRLIRENIKDVASPTVEKLSTLDAVLTPAELEVADLLRHGKSTKEISEMLNLSDTTVSFHRSNIRKKLKLKNKKINLQNYLRYQS